MARITFIYPNFENIGVEYLMAVCLKDGHDVNFIFYSAIDSYLNIKNKKINYQDIARQIADTKPHIAAFSCVTDNYLFQLNCANAVKKLMPEVITIFGGIHVTAVPEYVIKRPEIDCIAIGESEISFLEFINHCNLNKTCNLPDKAIKGIVFKKDNIIIGEFKEGDLPDLDLLPFPHKLPFYSALSSFSYQYYIMTSRGCPNKCSYCFNSFWYKTRGHCLIRQRSADNVISELLWAKKNFLPKSINFMDDCFTTNKRWIFEFCEKYKKQINLPFVCQTIPRYIDIEKSEALSKAGCCFMQIGVQSTDERLCSDVLHRRSNNREIGKTINILKKSGIMVQVDHMLGIPGDTLETQEDSVLFYNKYRPSRISVFWLTYYPNTPIIDTAKQNGLLNERDINTINEGIKLSEKSLHSGGSLKNPKVFYSIAAILNYLPLLPKWLITFFIKSKIYKIFVIENLFFSTLLPVFIITIINKKSLSERTLIIRYINMKIPFLGKKRIIRNRDISRQSLDKFL